MPWFSYLLSVWHRAYREFEECAGREPPKRGSKTELVEYALQNLVSPSGIADVERLCPSAGSFETDLRQIVEDLGLTERVEIK